MHVSDVFHAYKSGIYTQVEAKSDCPDFGKDEDEGGYGTNHALAIVGYGQEEGMDYWIVKNSWGGDWGEGGYIRVEMGANVCGIENDVVYVNMKGGESDDDNTSTHRTFTTSTSVPEPTTAEPTTTTAEPTTTTAEPTTTAAGSTQILVSASVLALLIL